LPEGIVTPVATKAGCTLTSGANGFTGRAKLVKGYGTIFTFRMTK